MKIVLIMLINEIKRLLFGSQKVPLGGFRGRGELVAPSLTPPRDENCFPPLTPPRGRTPRKADV